MSRSLRAVLATTALFATASIASAHPGSSMHNIADGLVHPLTGIDHLVAMVAVGIWAALGTRKHLWTLPTSFIAMLIVGLVIGRCTGKVPGAEVTIAASVVAIGLLIAGRVVLQTRWACAAAGLFALFHGLAHGAEIPQDVAAWHFAVGMVLTTAGLHLIGVLTGTLVRRSRLETFFRFSGAAIATCGLLIGLGVM